MIVIPMAGASRRFAEAGYARPKYELMLEGSGPLRIPRVGRHTAAALVSQGATRQLVKRGGRLADDSRRIVLPGIADQDHPGSAQIPAHQIGVLLIDRDAHDRRRAGNDERHHLAVTDKTTDKLLRLGHHQTAFGLAPRRQTVRLVDFPVQVGAGLR